MARVTIEDCTELVPNRFHLVQMAAIRTKQLKKGAMPLVSSDDNKEIVVALREVAAGFVKPDYRPDPEAPELTATVPEVEVAAEVEVEASAD
jgi:DNA-directed RNA polymerase subunit omega